jgi:hypothetical protein
MYNKNVFEIDIAVKNKFGLIRKRKIGFKFVMETWQLVSNYTQLAPVDWGRIEANRFTLVVYYCACKLWHLEHGKKIDFSEDDVEYWLGEIPSKYKDQLIDVMYKSRIGGESLEELIPKFFENEEEVKKKYPSMT